MFRLLAIVAVFSFASVASAGTCSSGTCQYSFTPVRSVAKPVVAVAQSVAAVPVKAVKATRKRIASRRIFRWRRCR